MSIEEPQKTTKIKPSPKTIEECLFFTLRKIKKFHRRLETNNFSIPINFEPEIKEIPDFEKAFQIFNFVKQACKEKKRFFDTSKYEYINLEENFEKLKSRSGFNQANFINLIDKCKMLMRCQHDDNLYIEKLKHEIIILNSQKNAIIEKTTNTINSMKKNQLDLIEKIKSLNENILLIDQGKHEIMKKTQQLQERTQENLSLKKELKKLTTSFNREKNMIIIHKNKEIKELINKLEYAEKYQKNEVNEKKEKFKYKNLYKEVKLEIETLMTENNKLACEVAQLNANNYAINESHKKIEKQLAKARNTIQFLVNTPAFKQVKKMFFNMEQLDNYDNNKNDNNENNENKNDNNKNNDNKNNNNDNNENNDNKNDNNDNKNDILNKKEDNNILNNNNNNNNEINNNNNNNIINPDNHQINPENKEEPPEKTEENLNILQKILNPPNTNISSNPNLSNNIPNSSNTIIDNPSKTTYKIPNSPYISTITIHKTQNSPETRAYISSIFSPSQSKIIVIGGTDKSCNQFSNLTIYDTLTNTWETKDDPINFSKGISGHSSNLIYDKKNNEQLFIFGGYNSFSHDYTNHVFIVSLKTFNFNQIDIKIYENENKEEKYPSKRSYHTSNYDRNKQVVYIYGGTNMNILDSKNDNFNNIWEFNIELSSWNKKLISNNIIKEKYGAPRAHSSLLINGKMYIFGGVVSFKKFYNEMFVINVDNHFTMEQIFYDGFVPEIAFHSAEIINKNYFVVHGGLNKNYNVMNDFYVFDIENKKFSKIEIPLIPKLFGHKILNANNGNLNEETNENVIYFVGGVDDFKYVGDENMIVEEENENINEDVEGKKENNEYQPMQMIMEINFKF